MQNLLLAAESTHAPEHAAAVAGGLAQYSWLIPAIPFLAFFLILFFGKRSPGRGSAIGIFALGINWILSIIVFAQTAMAGATVEKSLDWFDLGAVGRTTGGILEFGMRVDGLTAVMFVVVCTVSLLVQIYSSDYMSHEPRFTWYYAVLNLFTGSMLLLVISNNTLQMLVGWELVGVCSYFLVGHFFEEKANSSAAMKAFITTKTGDLGFVLGIFVLFVGSGTFNISELASRVGSGAVSDTVVIAGTLLLFCGAVGKSAQFPLHVWLPDAMAGPTPASALIHAATMVTAGVFMIARLFPVFSASAATMTVVAIIASITMLGSALIGMVQRDIKKVLAYSTISQLGYMMAAMSVGAAGAGIFHLFTHAFFKALLFLGAGSVIHAVHSNDMFDMGGLRKYMPTTTWTFLIGSLALAGVPPLAGFWSKDEIVAAAFGSEVHYTLANVNMLVFVSALITAFLTAFYMSRVCMLTFFGEYRRLPIAGGAAGTDGDHGHSALPHESGPRMAKPLMILGILSIIGGWVGIPFGKLNFFADWVHIEGSHHGPFVPWIAALSIFLAFAGIGLGYVMYAKPRFGFSVRDPLERLGPIHRLLENRFYIDDLYMAAFVKPVQYALARTVYAFDQKVVNGAVNAAGVITVLAGRATRTVDESGVDGVVNGLARAVDRLGTSLRASQSGNIQRYAVGLFAGVVVLAAFLFL